MSWFKEVTESAVGKKAVMAVSGLVLFGFVLAHMVGNLEIYRGAEALNTYAEHLRTLGEPILPRELALWIARFVLLGAVFLHIHSAWAVSRQSRAARPIPYAKVAKVQATYATRTMRWGGVIIVLFILYHLAHLTLGVVHPNFVEGDVYHNVITGFRVPWVAAFYILANIALGFHLEHGLWSLFQSLGWNHPRFNSWRRAFARTFALVITLGNLSFPLSVWFGLVQ